MGRSRVTDAQLRAAAPHAANLSELLRSLGLVACGGNYAIVRRRLLSLGLLSARFEVRRARPAGMGVAPEVLAEAVAAARTGADALRALTGSAAPGGYRPLRAALLAAGLSTDHWLHRDGSRGGARPREPLDEVLVRGRPTSSGLLRQRLVREGLREPRCEACRLDTWQGLPVALELDHINGDRDDNRLENLRLLCPNCHAQTSTWRGRNVGRRSRSPDGT